MVARYVQPKKASREEKSICNVAVRLNFIKERRNLQERAKNNQLMTGGNILN